MYRDDLEDYLEDQGLARPMSQSRDSSKERESCISSFCAIPRDFEQDRIVVRRAQEARTERSLTVLEGR